MIVNPGRIVARATLDDQISSAIMTQHPVVATGIGSWPGTDISQALKITFAEVPRLPYLPELPARGTGADLVGRGVAMLSGLSADLQPAGWRLTGAPGRDQHRARTLLRDDIDQLEEAAQGYQGPFKIAVAGPWTLAATVERPRGGRVLGDEGARRDLAQSLAAGTAEMAAEVSRRLPGLDLLVQVDEPLLPAVHTGELATVSGYARHRPVEDFELSTAITDLAEAVNDSLGLTTTDIGTGHDHGRVVPAVWLHCCTAGVPFGLLTDAGVGGFAIDLDQLTTSDWDTLGHLMSYGGWLGAGALNTADATATAHNRSADLIAQRILRLVTTLGLEPAAAARMIITPACGLSGFDEQAAVHALRAVGKAAEIVTEELGS